MNEEDKKLGREFLKSPQAKDIPKERKDLYAKAWEPTYCIHGKVHTDGCSACMLLKR